MNFPHVSIVCAILFVIAAPSGAAADVAVPPPVKALAQVVERAAGRRADSDESAML
jgi:hypothetical protein